MTIYNYTQKYTIFVAIGFQSNTHLTYAEMEILLSQMRKLKRLVTASLKLRTLNDNPYLTKNFLMKKRCTTATPQ